MFITQIDKLIKTSLKVWIICFFIFLVAVSIPGYIHLKDVYNQIPGELHSVNIVILFFVVPILLLSLLGIFLLHSMNKKITFKKFVLIFLVIAFEVIGIVGFISAKELDPSLDAYMVTFFLVVAFLLGMKACLFLVE